MGKRAVSIVPSGKFPVKIGAFLFSVIIVFFHSTLHVCPYNDGKNYLFSTFLSNIGIAGNSNDYYWDGFYCFVNHSHNDVLAILMNNLTFEYCMFMSHKR